MKVFSSVPRIVSGAGAIASLGDEVKRLKGGRVLVVCGRSPAKSGSMEPVADSLNAAGLQYAVFNGVQSDPGLDLLKDSQQITKGFKPEVIVGLGGGSVLDAAKLISVMETNEGPANDYYGIGNIPNPGLPSILIPTTAGTGSEVTNISVMSAPETGLKKAMISDCMYAKVALLDPELTMSLPPHLTATTGMDALVHAIESYVGVHASIFSDTLNLKAIRLIAGNLRRAFAHGQDQAARKAMLYASSLAGMAFCNTQNGLDHALALSIGSKYHLPHGLATAFILPWVMEFNCPANPDKFTDIAAAFGCDVKGLPASESALQSVSAVKSLLDDLGISYKLGGYGAGEEDFADIAKNALGATQLINNNPRGVTQEQIEEILRNSL